MNLPDFPGLPGLPGFAGFPLNFAGCLAPFFSLRLGLGSPACSPFGCHFGFGFGLAPASPSAEASLACHFDFGFGPDFGRNLPGDEGLRCDRSGCGAGSSVPADAYLNGFPMWTGAHGELMTRRAAGMGRAFILKRRKRHAVG